MIQSNKPQNKCFSLFFLLNDCSDFICINISLLRLWINRQENDSSCSFQIVNKAISTAFSFLNIRVANSDLKDRITNVRNLITNNVAILEFFNDGLNILVDATILFCQRTQITSEGSSRFNLYDWRITHAQSLPKFERQARFVQSWLRAKPVEN